jgi:hypothetical protein
MLKNLLGKLFTNDSKPETISPEFNSEIDELMHTLVNEAIEKNSDWYTVKLAHLSAYERIKSKDSSFKVALCFWLVDHMKKHFQKYGWSGYNTPEYRTKEVYRTLLNLLMRSSIDFTGEDLVSLLEAYKKDTKGESYSLFIFPVQFTINQLQKYVASKGLSDQLRDFLHQFLKWKELSPDYYPADADKAKIKVQEILSMDSQNAGKFQPVYLDDKDYFGIEVNAFTASLTGPSQAFYYALVGHFKKATGSKPTQKALKEIDKIIEKIGRDAYLAQAKKWLTFLRKLEAELQTHTQHYGGREYTSTSYTYLQETNLTAIKGLLWSLQGWADQETLELVAAHAEKCYRKIPGKGPLAAGVGNACIYLLANSSLVGISHLSRLKLKIRQSSTQALIENYIQEASKSHGVTAGEMEDMAVPDFGLTEGQRVYSFEGYQATLSICGIGKTDLVWQKEDGANLKTEPAAVKKNHAAQLKEIKGNANQIQKCLSAQRDRLDRSYIANRCWSYPKFCQYYLYHGLMAYLTRQLIWSFQKDEQQIDAFWQKDSWQDVNEQVVDWIDDDTQVKLWHPAGRSIDEIIAWREYMNRKEIRQPFKQAYREVYMLTEAEIRTHTYSNRMAAHILKQHQFNSLAKLRGWKYSLLGAYDDGRYNEAAEINLPEYGLQAQFWVNEVNANDAWNDTGIWNYISTDQVRFCRLTSPDIPLDLMDIDTLVLSEIMRDVDLFVGVASVGNDPNWQDNGGLPAYRDYWQSYSFGELTEVAKTRKAVLERLVPRLKIAKQSELRDKFLVVKGQLRTYKIHLGSGNILMEPNDQYLCIVPDRKGSTVAEGVFLPFEGDNVLSIILSKAFLLAEDTKIADPTITRQLEKH